MPGPPPKPDHMRQRRNKATTRSKLPATARRKGPKPKLPARGRGRGKWHPRVTAWWRDVWSSPMASEYLTVHRYGLEAIAELRQAFHTATDPMRLQGLHAEIRQSQRDYGLTPLDLRRLQWEVRRAVDAADAAEEEEAPKTPGRRRRGKKGEDPRKLLRLVE